MEQLSREQGINILHHLCKQWVDQNNQELEKFSVTEKIENEKQEERQKVV